MKVAMSMAALISDDPVFHRWGHRHGSTACGSSHHSITKYVNVLEAHAVVIGRPCGKCWTIGDDRG